jgi:hypothetical protein
MSLIRCMALFLSSPRRAFSISSALILMNARYGTEIWSTLPEFVWISFTVRFGMAMESPLFPGWVGILFARGLDLASADLKHSH